MVVVLYLYQFMSMGILDDLKSFLECVLDKAEWLLGIWHHFRNLFECLSCALDELYFWHGAQSAQLSVLFESFMNLSKLSARISSDGLCLV